MRSFLEHLHEQDALVDEKIDPRTFDLPALYRELNRTLFGGELLDVPITFGRLAKRTTGVTKGSFDPATYNRRMPLWYNRQHAKVDPTSITVTIAPFTFPLTTLRGVVAHEMVHVHNFQHHEIDPVPHGPKFHATLRRAQAKADFPIPLVDTSDPNDMLATPRTHGFLLVKTRTGSLQVLFTTKALVTHPQQTAQFYEFASRYMQLRQPQWLVGGICTTKLTAVAPVARSLTSRRGIPFYRLTDAELTTALTPTKIFFTSKNAPEEFRP